jgi:hypothetical protein
MQESAATGAYAPLLEMLASEAVGYLGEETLSTSYVTVLKALQTTQSTYPGPAIRSPRACIRSGVVIGSSSTIMPSASR